MSHVAEYIWLDGTTPTQELRSKSLVIPHIDPKTVSAKDFRAWSFDGSSTYQSDGSHSDLTLNPVHVVGDPIRGKGNYLVFCEVLNDNRTPHKTNGRARLRKVMEAAGNNVDPWIGFEQEYTLFSGHRPLGWPENGYPQPQGPFYCGVRTRRLSFRGPLSLISNTVRCGQSP